MDFMDYFRVFGFLRRWIVWLFTTMLGLISLVAIAASIAVAVAEPDLWWAPAVVVPLTMIIFGIKLLQKMHRESKSPQG